MSSLTVQVVTVAVTDRDSVALSDPSPLELGVGYSVDRLAPARRRRYWVPPAAARMGLGRDRAPRPGLRVRLRVTVLV